MYITISTITKMIITECITKKLIGWDLFNLKKDTRLGENIKQVSQVEK